ncbi:hypothetical protein D3C72_1599020 [compost metagenome]
MDGVEDLVVHGVELADGFQRIEDLGVRQQVVAEGHRHALEHHVVALLLDPGFEVGLEVVAVRAAVPEELGDLDLARGDRLRRLQDLVFLALGGRGLGRRGHQQAAHGGEHGEQCGEFLHLVRPCGLDDERMTAAAASGSAGRRPRR